MSKDLKIGLWGGSGGQLHVPEHTPCQLVNVVVCWGDAITSIKFTYKDTNGNTHVNNLWGGPGGSRGFVDLQESEHLKEISGTFGSWGSNVPKVITSLKFVTSKGETHEFGKTGRGCTFHVPLNKGETHEFGKAGGEGTFHVPLDEGKITGFFARVGDLIDAIGIYVLP